jgi:hypothetical protein
MKRLFCFSVLGFFLIGLCNQAFAAEVSIPDYILKSSVWASLGRPKPVGVVTEEDMLKVTEMSPASPFDSDTGVTTLEGLGAAHHLVHLQIASIRADSLTVPPGLSNLSLLALGGGKALASLTFPADLKSLKELYVGGHRLTDQDFLLGLTNLTTLDLGGNDMTSLRLPPGLTNLTRLSVGWNSLTNYDFLSGLTSLKTLNLGENLETTLTLPSGLPQLTTLNFGGDPSYTSKMTNSYRLAGDVSHLTIIELGFKRLKSVTLPNGLRSLTSLNLKSNRLTSLILPSGLIALTNLDLSYNQLLELTLPAELSNLTTLNLNHNPLRLLTLPRRLAETNLKSVVAKLKNIGVLVRFSLELSAVQATADGSLIFLLTGPPGTYRIQVTPDLSTWTNLRSVAIADTVSVTVTDPLAKSREKGFYRAIQSN